MGSATSQYINFQKQTQTNKDRVSSSLGVALSVIIHKFKKQVNE